MLVRVSIAITEEHRTLAGTVADFLAKNGSRAAARVLLEAPHEPNASFYADAAALGWLGLHIPEAYGGSGYGLEEVVVVAEELGKALAPGAFVPTLIAGAVLAEAGTDEVRQRFLPGLADGSRCGAVALGGEGMLLADLLAASGLVPSKSEARRAIKGGGIYLNNLRVGEETRKVTAEDALGGRLLVLRKGRRDYHLVRVLG